MDGTLALAQQYEAPALVWRSARTETHPILWWAVFVGWAYSAALAWAWYCIYSGGSPDISLTWRGFKVACYR